MRSDFSSDSEKSEIYFEFGAHFKYSDLVNKLNLINEKNRKLEFITSDNKISNRKNSLINKAEYSNKKYEIRKIIKHLSVEKIISNINKLNMNKSHLIKSELSYAIKKSKSNQVENSIYNSEIKSDIFISNWNSGLINSNDNKKRSLQISSERKIINKTLSGKVQLDKFTNIQFTPKKLEFEKPNKIINFTTNKLKYNTSFKINSNKFLTSNNNVLFKKIDPMNTEDKSSKVVNIEYINQLKNYINRNLTPIPKRTISNIDNDNFHKDKNNINKDNYTKKLNLDSIELIYFSKSRNLSKSSKNHQLNANIMNSNKVKMKLNVNQSEQQVDESKCGVKNDKNPDNLECKFITTNANIINFNNSELKNVFVTNTVNNNKIKSTIIQKPTVLKNMWKVSQKFPIQNSTNLKIQVLNNNLDNNINTLQQNFSKLIPNSTTNKNKKFISFI